MEGWKGGRERHVTSRCDCVRSNLEMESPRVESRHEFLNQSSVEGDAQDGGGGAGSAEKEEIGQGEKTRS